MMSTMVGTRHGQGLDKSSKVISVVLEAVEGRTETLQESQIARKD